MVYKIKLNGKCYEVVVEKKSANLVGVSDVPVGDVTAGKPAAPIAQSAPAAAPTGTPAAPTAAPASAASNVQSGEPVKAPMPGDIIAINAAAGDSVKKGQVLIILEAMKMENEILSPKDGVVANIEVSKGTSVSAGDTLLYLYVPL